MMSRRPKLTKVEKALIVEALSDLRRRYEVPQGDEADNGADLKMAQIDTLIDLYSSEYF